MAGCTRRKLILILSIITDDNKIEQIHKEDLTPAFVCALSGAGV